MSLIRVPLIKGESLHGFALRLASANILKVSNLERECGLRLDALTQTAASIVNLAEMAGMDAATLMAMSYQRDGERWLCSFMGHMVDTRLLSIAPRKACPACLAESSHHRMVWDIHALTACARHTCALLTHCPACGDPLGWRSPEITDCPCGASFIGTSRGEADRIALTAAKEIHKAAEQARQDLNFDLSDALWRIQVGRNARLYRQGRPVPRRGEVEA